MAIEDFAAEPATAASTRPQVRFSRPLRFVVRAVLFLALIGFLGFILQDGLRQAFMTNPGLNGLIVGALLVGCLIALRELWRLHSEARAATSLAVNPASAEVRRGQVIAPLGSVLPALEQGTLAPAQAASTLESIAVRLDDGREVLRYLGGLLVFLGLLGTFWGLLDTVGSVGGVIKSLRTGAEAGVLFDELKAGLSAPLAGMAGLANDATPQGSPRERVVLALRRWLRYVHATSRQAHPNSFDGPGRLACLSMRPFL